MPALICESCGGPLQIIEPDKLAQCPFCKTMYTLPLYPVIDDEAMLQAAPFMERGKIYLSDKLFMNAANYFDKALTLCPTHGEAFLLRGFCDLKIKYAEEIDPKKRWTIFDNHYISKAMTFLSDELREDFLKKLGITYEEYEKEINTKKWKKRALSVRHAFEDAYKKEHPVYCEDVKQKIEDIGGKYKDKYDELKGEIEKYDRIIDKLERKLGQISVYNIGDNIYYGRILDEHKNKRTELAREMAALNDTIGKEQGEVFSSIKAEVADTDLNSVEAISALFPIPELTVEDSLLTDRIVNICLSRYEPFTFEEILSHPLIGSTNEKRVLSSLKRLVTIKELTSFEKDGTTYYMPTDIAWIFAPEEVL